MLDRNHAEQLYNQGVMTAQDKTYATNLQTAYQHFVSSVYADPTFGLGWYGIGNANSDLMKLEASVACFRRALECENDQSQRARILCNLGWRLHCLGETDEGFELSLESAKFDPNLSLTWLNLAAIHGIYDQTFKAVECARKGYALDPNDPQGEVAVAFALLFDRQFKEGFKFFEARYKYKLQHFMAYPYPKWQGEPGKTVFVMFDQGLGDTLSFARFLEAASRRAKYLHVCIQPELMRLFQHAFLHLKNVNLIPGHAHFPAADAWTTFVSLPFALGLSDDEIRNAPQIEAPVFTMPKTWKVEGRKLHIGIAWRGSGLNDINEHRSIPVTQFLDLYKVPGIQLYSLQVDESRNQLHDSGCGALIRDLSPYIRDVCDTVSLLQDLDLVITCESALGHICTLARKEVWVPYSYLGRDYRVGSSGGDQLWSSYRVFRQDKRRTWQPVFQQIETALRERLSSG